MVKNIFKSAMAILLSTSLMIGVSGCAKRNSDEKVMPEYSVSELEDGYYIRANDKFYPIYQEGINDNPKYYQWFTDRDQMVPELNEASKIVYVSKTQRPNVYEFQRMIDYGYTVGIKFDIVMPNNSLMDEDINSPAVGDPIISFPTDNYNPLSKVKLAVDAKVDEGRATKLESINGLEVNLNMFTPEGFLKGLNANKMYKFAFYEGTIYKDVDIKADTHLFVEDVFFRTNSYNEVKNTYFEINLPNDMPNGYYLIDGKGLFKYTGGEDIDLVNLPENTQPIENLPIIVPEPTAPTVPTAPDITNSTEPESNSYIHPLGEGAIKQIYEEYKSVNPQEAANFEKGLSQNENNVETLSAQELKSLYLALGMEEAIAEKFFMEFEKLSEEDQNTYKSQIELAKKEMTVNTQPGTPESTQEGVNPTEGEDDNTSSPVINDDGDDNEEVRPDANSEILMPDQDMIATKEGKTYEIRYTEAGRKAFDVDGKEVAIDINSFINGAVTTSVKPSAWISQMDEKFKDQQPGEKENEMLGQLPNKDIKLSRDGQIYYLKYINGYTRVLNSDKKIIDLLPKHIVNGAAFEQLSEPISIAE